MVKVDVMVGSFKGRAEASTLVERSSQTAAEVTVTGSTRIADNLSELREK
jgi:hypothetical protein